MDLPPLHTLAAFEAAARCGSFLAAAQTLNLTPSAISHRIKTLENWLGQPLFERRHREVVLTETGRAYLAEVQAALGRLTHASTRLRGTHTRSLRLSVAPALGAKWFVAQLADYRATQPGIEFVLSSASTLEPVASGRADVAICYGDPPWPGLEAYALRQESVFPVCSPALAARLGTPPDPARLDTLALLRHPLLQWQPWFEAAGLKRAEPADGLLFEDSMLMLEAAAAGVGIALTVSLLARGYLADGTLVRPFDTTIAGKGFHAVLRPEAYAQAWIRQFVRWLQVRAREDSST